MDGWISFDGSDKNIGVSGLFEFLIKSCIHGVYLMGCSMSHEYKSFCFFQIRKFCCYCVDCLWFIFRICKKRSSKCDFVKRFFIRKNFFFHNIILDTVQDMGRLNNHLPDPVCDHLFKSFLYSRNRIVISFFQNWDDKFTGPCTIDPMILKSVSNVLFNLFYSGFSGCFIAGSEAHDQNRFICLLIHKKYSPKYLFSAYKWIIQYREKKFKFFPKTYWHFG